MDKDELARLGPALDSFLEEFEECAIVPTRRLIAAYIRGQLGPLPRKSVMPIARDAGIAPRTLQELLSLHRWDEQRMRRLLQERIARARGGARTVAVLHETACVKKGTKTPGVERQFSRALGRTANCCVLLQLVVAEAGFEAAADADLYLPEAWCEDGPRRRQAGVPDPVRYRSRARIALDLIDRAGAAGVRFGLFIADPAYVEDGAFLKALDDRGVRHAGEVAGTRRGWLARPGGGPGRMERPRSIDEIAAGLRLQRRALGGERETAASPDAWPADALDFVSEADGLDGPPRRVLVFRNPWGGGPRFVSTGGASDAPPSALLDAVLSGRPVANRFDRMLGEIGFEHFEVRRFQSLIRHLVLSAASLLFLAETRQRGRLEGADRAWPGGAEGLRNAAPL